jgi:hypothetical protein
VRLAGDGGSKKGEKLLLKRHMNKGKFSPRDVKFFPFFAIFTHLVGYNLLFDVV